MEPSVEVNNLLQGILYAASRLQNSPEKFARAITAQPRVLQQLKEAVDELDELTEFIENLPS